MGKLDRKDVQEILALTPLQQGLLFQYLRNPREDSYFNQLILNITGEIDVLFFEKAWNFLIKTNEILRTVFRWEKLEKPTQMVLKKQVLRFKYLDLSGIGSRKAKENELGKIVREDRENLFNLREVPFRVCLCKVKAQHFQILVSNHHILYDGWSTGIILQEFFKAYETLSEGGQLQTPISKPRFREFVRWQLQQDKQLQKDFWENYFLDYSTQPELPIKQSSLIPGKSEETTYRFVLEENVQRNLEKMIKEKRLTLAASLYCAWGILLQRYSNSMDVVFGITVSGRSCPIKGIERMVGLLINTLPLRITQCKEETIEELLNKINQRLNSLKAYENTPLVDVSEIAGLGKEQKLFDTILAVENYPLDNYLKEQQQWKINSYTMEEKTQYGLGVTISVMEQISFDFIYNNQCFEKGDIMRMASHLRGILEHIYPNVERRVQDIEILSENEKKQIIIDFNQASEGIGFTSGKSIPLLFEAQKERNRDCMAAVDSIPMPHTRKKGVGVRGITYGELNREVNQFATLMLETGVNPGMIISIMVERSIEMVKGLLSILKAGGAYLPIDTKSPEERVRYILNDSGATLLITTRRTLNNTDYDREIIYIDEKKGDNEKAENQMKNVPPSFLAYVIYTSGSTGKPKGVLIQHRNISPLLHWGYTDFGLGTSDRTLQNLSCFFDWSAWEIFVTLTSGASLYIPLPEILQDPESAVDYIRTHTITVLHITPTQFQYFLNVPGDFRTLDYLFVGAENLKFNIVQQAWEKVREDCRVFNMYGPTEATIISATLEIFRNSKALYEKHSSLPIGNPSANAKLLVLDKNGNVCPLYVPGELYIAGEGVAPGYLNRPELTAEKFEILSNINSTSYENIVRPGAQIYKTGDLCRWLPDGTVEFLGRIDHQVKIRGFRIELGEIENQLAKLEGMKEVIVVVQADKEQEPILCAYYVSTHSFEIQEIRKYLTRDLPEYMIPSYFVQLEEFPLNPNGKVDRKALPKPEIQKSRRVVPPGNDLEKKLAGIWSEVLGIEIEKIGIDDDFFQLGGHSLKATLLAAKIQKKLDANITLSELLAKPNIGGQAECIKKSIKKTFHSIQPTEKKEYYPLSSSQKRLFFLQQVDKKGVSYNMSASWKLKGAVEKNKLEKAISKLIERHEGFRTSFLLLEKEGKPIQKISDKTDFRIEYHFSAGAEEDLLRHFIRPFDLSRAPILRIGFIGINGKDPILMVDLHHIISDGASIQVLMTDFASLYSGEHIPLPRLQYKEFSEWQNSDEQKEAVFLQQDYWVKQYSGEIPVLELPTDYPRPIILDFQGNSKEFELEKEHSQQIRELALGHGTTIFMVLFTIYTILLSKLTGQEDIVAGTPYAGRRHSDLERIPGMFVNTLALRSFPYGGKRVSDYLKELTTSVLEAFENQEYPFDDLVEQLEIKRDTSRNPMFDTVFTMENFEVPEIELPGLTLKQLKNANNISKFDLVLHCVEGVEGGRLTFTFDYRIHLFDISTIERIINYFKNILICIIEKPEIQLSEIDILTDIEKHQILFEFNDIHSDFSTDKTIHQLFEEQVKKSPDGIVLVGCNPFNSTGKPEDQDSVEVTYACLNQHTQLLAERLIKKGIKTWVITAIVIERSIEMVLGLLGILKAGGTYLPIDPKSPPERIQYILDDSEAALLLSHRCILENEFHGREMVHIEETEPGKTITSRIIKQSASSPAYVIYTSGSTGRPKGVLITHRNICPLLHWGYADFALGTKDRTLQNLSYFFDWSAWEIFITITSGAGLYIPHPEVILNPEALTHYINTHAITTLHITPTQFQYLLNVEGKLESLDYLFIGAEKLTLNVVKQAYEKIREDCRVFNMYGPTEATIISATLEIKKGKVDEYGRIPSVPIGIPSANANLLILDKYGQLCPLKVSGELFIYGDGVAPGYLNRPDLSKEKFKTDSRELSNTTRPHFHSPGTRNNNIYRTGDLCRWLLDGNIEFLGRIDHQVKIRGFRIELGEIENQLSQLEGIKEAIVLALDEKNKSEKRTGKYLCAYYVSDQFFETSDLRKRLSKDLPDYMIPTFFVKMEEIPLNPNGKVDRKALPIPAIESVETYVPPRDMIEKNLVAIWSGVLGIEPKRIGIDDDFFQLGGHSLKATLMAAQIKKELQVNFPLQNIFLTPHIRGMAVFIKESSTERFQAISPVEEKEYYPLSSAQKRLYVLQQMDEGGITYNIPSVWQLEGNIDKPLIEQAFLRLIQRHSNFRTSFQMKDGAPVQYLLQSVEFNIQYQEPGKTKEEILEEEWIQPFDLSQAPLLRVCLIKTKEQHHLLVVDMHHIISDGISVQLFIKEFLDSYQGEELSTPKLQYRDFSEWEQEPGRKEFLKQQRDYWIKEFGEEIPVLDLPTDFPRPLVRSFAGQILEFSIGKYHYKDINELVLERGATLFMVLFSLFQVLLSKLSGQEDIVVGTPVAGRNHADLEHILGMFVVTLPLRAYPIGDITFTGFLQQEKESLLRAFENQDYPFEDLVEDLVIQRDTGRNPLFDVMFAFLPSNISSVQASGLTFHPLKYQRNISKFDLMLIAEEEKGEKINFTLEYCTKLFSKDKIQRFAGYFKKVITEVLEKPDKKIQEIEILSPQEKIQILNDFNITHMEYPMGKCIHKLIEENQQQTKDTIAVGGYVSDPLGDLEKNAVTQLTYGYLGKRSNQLALLLQEQGIGRDTLVGLMLGPCVQLMIGILGILKSGGAYLPIAPNVPKGRIEFILKDSAIPLVIYQKKWKEKITILGRFLDIDQPGMDREGSKPPVFYQNPKDLAYVIYTSGSTGRPKGVGVEHSQLVNFVYHMNYCYHGNIDCQDRCLGITNIMFDVSVWEFFLPLVFGARLMLFPENRRFDVLELAEAIINEGITLLYLPPGLLKPICEQLEKQNHQLKLNKMLVGVEPIRDEVLEGYVQLNSQMQIINGYGPTETCICATSLNYISHEPKGEIVPIGAPLSNNQVALLDRADHLVPPGIPGEICISGKGVSRGYLNNPDLTSEKYTVSPFFKDKIMYRSGDLAQWLPGGDIRFMGRRDHQLKIRGYRIELGEIENRLLTHPHVKQAWVIAKSDEIRGKYLCAYIVTGSTVETSKLRKYLSMDLPDYMIPSYFVELTEIPLTSNGKVDKKALPNPEFQLNEGEGFIPPRDDIEIKLAEIWGEILGTDKNRIGLNDDFFHMGGHSLKATLLSAQIQKDLEVRIPLQEIFRISQLSELAHQIKITKKEQFVSMKPVEKRDYYPLSSAQKRMYVLQQMDLEGIGYNIPSIWHLEGTIDENRLQQGFLHIIKQHESLRTTFHQISEEPVQRIHEAETIEFSIEYPKEEMECRDESCIHPLYPDKMIEKCIRAFDLSIAPLLRVEVLTMEEHLHLLLVDIHHIISDGESVKRLIEDFTLFYEQGNSTAPKLHYKDFTLWQQGEAQKKTIEQQKIFWEKQFEEEIPVLNLPVDFQRPMVQSFRGSSVPFVLDVKTTEAVKSLARKQETTQFILLLSIYTVLLCKLSGQEDIVVGTPTAGRRHADLESMIGMFVNILALRNFPKGGKDFIRFLNGVNEGTLQAFENQDYPFDDLVEQVGAKRDTSRNPLFDTLFSFQEDNIPEIHLPGLKLRPFKYKNSIVKFDLVLQCIKKGEKLYFTFEYSRSLFALGTMKRFVDYFQKILFSIIGNPKTKLSELEIITEQEKRKILYEFNDPSVKFPVNKTIHGLFEGQVVQTPDRVAVVCSDPKSKKIIPKGTIVIAYQVLDNKSQGLAELLKEKGIIKDRIAAILVERSFEMILGLLGILKAGGAYLPMDPKTPKDRIQYMMNDSKAMIMLTSSEKKGELGLKEEVVCLDEHHLLKDTFKQGIEKKPSDTLAYVIYTSGSTGKPKGVLINHGNICPLLHWGYHDFGLSKTDRTLQNLSFFFDWSAWEIFITLTTGAGLFLPHPEVILNPDATIEYINTHAITVLHITPTQIQYLLNTNGTMETLDYLFIGAEKLTDNLVQQCYEKIHQKCRVFNMYGPTEATIISATLEIQRDLEELYKKLTSVPIGNPSANAELLILDHHLNWNPENVEGELHVCGDGVASGYMNRPELTAEKFIKSPKLRTPEKIKREQKSVYRSGDLCRWLPDGRIEFLGRIDQQVKIRGFRIELGEIENHLSKLDGIKESIVLSHDKERIGCFLCAYIVLEGSIEITTLRKQLAKSIPDYMIPSFFMKMDSLPLTPNGKIDKKALPIPGVHATEEHVAPRDSIEKKLVEIWARVLGVEEVKIGIYDDFFQLGGHSLKATQLVGLIQKELAVKIALTDLFTYPQIHELASIIKESVGEKFIRIEPVEKRDYYPLSSAQKRLYVLNQIEQKGTGYNIPSIWKLEGKVDKHKLQKTVCELIKQHESLRTSFHLSQTYPVQRIHQKVEVKIESQEYSQKHPIKKDKLPVSEIIKNFIQPFDLSRAPLLRIFYIEVDKKTNILLMDMHHIISDGASVSIFIKDVAELYAGHQLMSWKLDYKDFSLWQEGTLQREVLKRQKAYWIKQFEEEAPVLNLPTDYARPVIQGFEGNYILFELGRKIRDALMTLTRNEGTTLFTLLIAIYTIFLAKITGQEDVVVGTPTAGRRHADLKSIMGMFVNTLALRNYPKGETTMSQYLAEVKKCIMEALENQDYPFDDLVEQVGANRDTSRNPLFDTVLTHHLKGDEEIQLPGLKLIPYDYDNQISKFDLVCQCIEREESLQFILEYSVHLFMPETIERFTQYIRKVVHAVIEKPQQLLSEVEIITKKEKHTIMYQFNDPFSQLPTDKTIHGLFEEQATHTPNYIALVSYETGSVGSKERITYQVLNERTYQLAQLLSSKGVKPGDVIAIQVERSIEMVLGMVGILKAGCAYLPIDPKIPENRLQYQLKDSKAVTLLTQHKINQDPQLKTKLFYLDDPIQDTGKENQIPVTKSPDSLAYIIYTSGSTGKPKGVLITHRNICPLLHWGYRDFRISHRDRALQNLSYFFDWSAWEIFIILTTGAKLYLPHPELQTNPGRMIDYMNMHRITILHATPTQFQYLLQVKGDMRTLQYLFIGAEKLTDKLVQQAFEKIQEDCRVFNMYGPTESTIISATLEIPRERDLEKSRLSSVPIGTPTANATLMILDKHDHLCPVSVEGELVVLGDGVAPGYLNQPELTQSKFETSIYFKNEPEPNTEKRSYRTGDLCRWIPDGSVEFLGRIDHQVKIRGYRIELGEIENQISKLEEVKEAIVTVREEKGESYLCAYLVTGKVLTISQIREKLRKQLPSYMIPSFFMFLEQIPLNQNGKVDKKALPAPDHNQNHQETTPAVNKTEEDLIRIYAKVLGIEENRIGRHSNFFELGGHSLKAALLTGNIYEHFRVKLPLADIFTAPVISELADLISTTETTDLKLHLIEEQEYYPLSYNQKRLWLLHQVETETSSYNLPGKIQLNQVCDKEIVEQVLYKIVAKHESLRTGFRIVGEQPVQYIKKSEEITIPFQLRDISRLEGGKKETERENIYLKERDYPFDLTQPPLFRALLLKVQEEQYDLIFNMHHIVTDGWSLEVLKKEFLTKYTQHSKTEETEYSKDNPSKMRYRDFALWHNRHMSDPRVKNVAEKYWREKYQEGAPVLQLPVKTLGDPRDNTGAAYICYLNNEISNRVLQLAKETQTTPFTLLFALYLLLISRLSNQKQVISSIISAGRDHESLLEVVGFFVNSIPFTYTLEKRKTFKEYVQQLHRDLLNSFQHQAYPLEMLFKQLKIKYPEIPVSFNMLNLSSQQQPKQMEEKEEKEVKTRHIPNAQDVKFQIEIYVTPLENSTMLYWAYKKSLYSPLDIEYTAREYLHMADYFTKYTDKSIEGYKEIKIEKQRTFKRRVRK